MADRFANLADEFITRVRASRIDPATEVFLVYHCVNQDGAPVEPIRVPIAPTTHGTLPGNGELARQFAARAHREAIIANINSHVGHASTEPMVLKGGPPFPVIIRDISLEIVQPADEPGKMNPTEANGKTLIADPVPLRVDEGGVVRVGNSRVSLDLVVEQFENGMTPEDMVRAYDTLRLADVYAVIAYYLRHRDEVRAYLERREAEAAALRAKIEAERPRIGPDELLSRRA